MCKDNAIVLKNQIVIKYVFLARLKKEAKESTFGKELRYQIVTHSK